MHILTVIGARPQFVKAAAEKILVLANDVALRKRMGAAACEFVCEKYSWTDSVAIMKKLFEDSVK